MAHKSAPIKVRDSAGEQQFLSFYCMFTAESSSVELRPITMIYELKQRNPRDSVYGLYWTRLGKVSG
jgi:hypothetical protein